MADSPERVETVQATPDEDARYIGVVTRAVSWGLDAVLINLVAIITGVGISLFLAIVPFSKHAEPALKAIAGGAYILWCAAYFVLFWSTTGQTPGARVMQIRQVTATQQRVKPVRALVRWVGMNLAMVPLFAGYVPILFKRRGFPDWLAKTLVLDAQQLSLAGARQATLRAARDSSRGGRSPTSRPEPEASSPPVADSSPAVRL